MSGLRCKSDIQSDGRLEIEVCRANINEADRIEEVCGVRSLRSGWVAFIWQRVHGDFVPLTVHHQKYAGVANVVCTSQPQIFGVGSRLDFNPVCLQHLQSGVRNRSL